MEQSQPPCWLVVTFVLELEFDHPVDQLGGRRAGYFRHPGVKVQQIAAGVTDDSAGVIGAHDYPERRRDRLLSYGEHNGRVFGFGGFAQGGHGLVHPGSVRIGDVPPPHFRACPDQRQDRVREGSHKVILINRGPRPQGGDLASRSGVVVISPKLIGNQPDTPCSCRMISAKSIGA